MSHLLPRSALLSALVFCAPPPDSVEWRQGSLGDAVAEARRTAKMVLIYCWADGSERCGQLWQETLGHADAQSMLGDFVCFNAKHSLPGSPELFERFGVQTLPTLLFLDSSGQAEDLIQGYIPLQDFQTEAGRIRRGEGTVSSLRATAEREVADGEASIDARWALAGKLQALGDQATHDLLLESIRKDDPEGRTATGAQLALNELLSSATLDGTRAPEEWNWEPIEDFVVRCKHPSVVFAGWQSLGNLHIARADAARGLKAFEAAWKHCADAQRASWAESIASWMVEHAEERNSKERKFALKLAQAAAEAEPTEDDHEGTGIRRAFLLARVLRMNGQEAKAVQAARQALESAGESDGELRDAIEKFLAAQ